MKILIYLHFFMHKSLLKNIAKDLRSALRMALNSFNHIFIKTLYINNIKKIKNRYMLKSVF